MNLYSQTVILCIIALLAAFSLLSPYARADTEIETEWAATVWGFPNSRDTTDTGYNSKLLINSTNFVHLPFLNDKTLSVGYRYSAILESQGLVSVGFDVNDFRFESGLVFGFRNTLPITVIPGLHEKVTLVLNMMEFSIYGETSVFLSPFFSLSSANTLFDQNLFGLSSSIPIGKSTLKLYYEKKRFVRRVSGQTVKNWNQTYEMNVRTSDFTVNSLTGLGYESAGYKAQFYHKLIGLYVSETFIISIRRYDFSVGTKVYIITVPLKDLDSLSIRSTPVFSVNCGLKICI